MSTSLRAFFFDMDGLLIDTEDLHMRAFAETAAALGYAREPREYACWIGHSSWKVSAWLAEQVKVRTTPDEIMRIEQENFLRILREERPAPLAGSREMFDACDALGLPRALVSSTVYPQVVKTMEVVLGHFGREPDLERHFGAVVTGDRVTNLKPDPEPYLKAAAGLGVPPERCIVFEDSPAGVKSARAAGCRVVAIPNEYLEPGEVVREAHAHFKTLKDAFEAGIWERW
ncbi:MAG: HAD family phosphatase [Planctomycetota bacterium]|nr:HAD family phosphatase [Planctomycetota bacterium]